MSAWELKVIAAEAQRLLALAVKDAGLREELRALAEDILRATEGSLPLTTTTASPRLSPVTKALPAAVEPLRELTLGRSRASPPGIPPVPTEMPQPLVADVDLAEIMSRCRLNAEGARRAAARQRRIREGDAAEAEISLEDPEIVAAANRLADHFYWMNSPPSKPAEIALLDDVGGCFEAVAGAIALILDADIIRPGRLERSLPLLAEAQSALRTAIQGIQAPNDPDQLAVFEWLKRTAAQHHVYIKRHMRADDLADSTRWRDLLDRIAKVDARFQKTRRRSQKEGAWIDRVRRQLELIGESQGAEPDWQELIKTIDEMVGEGIAPSNSEIRELLLPVIDELPDRDELPPGFRLVLREIDRFLANRTPSSVAAAAPEPTAEVKEAKRLLEGRSAVLIGGICRRESQKLLKTSLGLRELTWIETREHQSIGAFEFPIARADVALVLLAIRWSSHAFGDVKQFCDRYGKPLVRLPGGYSPNQVAAQILSQCSGQLGAG
jgi:hypothetical protein